MKFSDLNISLCGRVEAVLAGGELQEGGGIGGSGIAAGGHGPGRKLRQHLRVVEGGDCIGTLTLVGITGVAVQVNSQTTFRGVGAPTQLSDLNPRDRVKIQGRRGLGNHIIATEVERTTATWAVALEGPVDSATDLVVTILGLVVDTTSIPENKFRGVDGIAIGRQAFFHSLDTGMVVKLEGTHAGDTIVWTQAEVRSPLAEPHGEEWKIQETDEQHRDRVALMRVIRYEMIHEASMKNRDRGKIGRALSINISRGGMLILMDREPMIDQPLRVFMPTPAGSVNIPTVVDVRWTRKLPLLTGTTRGVYFVGLRFVL